MEAVGGNCCCKDPVAAGQLMKALDALRKRVVLRGRLAAMKTTTRETNPDGPARRRDGPVGPVSALVLFLFRASVPTVAFTWSIPRRGTDL